jgi:hypothetical protein
MFEKSERPDKSAKIYEELSCETCRYIYDHGHKSMTSAWDNERDMPR